MRLCCSLSPSNQKLGAADWERILYVHWLQAFRPKPYIFRAAGENEEFYQSLGFYKALWVCRIIFTRKGMLYERKRFEVIYSQGTMDIVRILVDQRTGVNYLQVCDGYAGGLTPSARPRRKTRHFAGKAISGLIEGIAKEVKILGRPGFIPIQRSCPSDFQDNGLGNPKGKARAFWGYGRMFERQLSENLLAAPDAERMNQSARISNELMVLICPA